MTIGNKSYQRPIGLIDAMNDNLGHRLDVG